MKGQRGSAARVRGVALVNRQKAYAIPVAALRPFVRDLRHCLRLEKKEFNICFVDNDTIRHLNFAFRSKDRATDVLSFPWAESDALPGPKARSDSRWRPQRGITNFLGEVVISVPMARRNAAREGHSLLREMRWLILHGVLHLLGYDHERDSGEMTALELALREQFRVAGSEEKKEFKRQKFNSPRF